MRIRTIKPEFWISESIGRLSRDARLLFIGLWSFADDSGRGRGALPMIAGALFPFDDDAREKLPGWFAELEREGMARRYHGPDGNMYFDLPKFLKHQRIDKPSDSKIPPFVEDSPNTPRILLEAYSTPLPCTYVAMEQGKGTMEREQQGAVAPAAGAASPPESPELPLTTEPAKPKRQPTPRFTPPTMQELGAYAAEIGMAPARAAQFMDYQTAKGWKVGTAPMKCWRAALRTWNARPDFNAPAGNGGNSQLTGQQLMAMGKVDPNRPGRTPETQLPTDDEWTASRNRPPAPDDDHSKIRTRKALIAYWRRDCRDEEAAGKPISRERPYPWHKAWAEMTPDEKAAKGLQPYGIH